MFVQSVDLITESKWTWIKIEHQGLIVAYLYATHSRLVVLSVSSVFNAHQDSKHRPAQLLTHAAAPPRRS